MLKLTNNDPKTWGHSVWYMDLKLYLQCYLSASPWGQIYTTYNEMVCD